MARKARTDRYVLRYDSEAGDLLPPGSPILDKDQLKARNHKVAEAKASLIAFMRQLHLDPEAKKQLLRLTAEYATSLVDRAHFVSKSIDDQLTWNVERADYFA